MSYGAEKRRLLGLLAALAPIPLPFNDVGGWFSLLIFEVAVVWFLFRARDEQAHWLSFRAMNVLAVSYLPFLALDFTLFWRGRVLEPLVHLAMFALVVKLFGLQREKDKWQALFGIFFLFLAGTGTSVHPSLAIYLIAWWTLGIFVMFRFAALELFARHQRVRRPQPIPVGGFLTFALPFLLLVAVPLFAFMPRLRQPYVMLPGGGGGSDGIRVSGLQEQEISLDFIGRIRTDRTVAFRIRYEGEEPMDEDLRFRAGSFERFSDNRWFRDEQTQETLRDVQRGPDGLFRVARGRLQGWAEIWLQPGPSTALPLPVEAAAVDMPFGLFITALRLDDAGVARLYRPPRELLKYRVALTDGEVEDQKRMPRVARAEVRGRRSGPALTDAEGVTARIADLARRVAGDGTPSERARRLESHLLSGYDYTLDLLGGAGGHRIERFLFDDGRGHCELFASALVLMLRAEGIPARLVSGYLGGDYNPLESYFVVRQSNAHAWVEAEVEGGRWLVLDPTPPPGRPGRGGAGLGELASQFYDFVLFRWDRYVLTYGFADQVGALLGMRDVWGDLMAWWNARQQSAEERDVPESPAAAPATARPEASAEPAGRPSGSVGWLSLVVLLAGVGLWLWKSRPGPTARNVYLRLRARLPESEARPAATLAPLDVARRLARAEPEAAEAVHEIVSLYVLESFGGRILDETETGRLERAWSEITRARRAA